MKEEEWEYEVVNQNISHNHWAHKSEVIEKLYRLVPDVNPDNQPEIASCAIRQWDPEIGPTSWEESRERFLYYIELNGGWENYTPKLNNGELQP